MGPKGGSLARPSGYSNFPFGRRLANNGVIMKTGTVEDVAARRATAADVNACIQPYRTPRCRAITGEGCWWTERGNGLGLFTGGAIRVRVAP